MSVLLTSPAFLLMLPALRRYGRSRLVTGAALAVAAGRPRQPHALQPGLGPVRLPVQQRLRAVRAAPRRARHGPARRRRGAGRGRCRSDRASSSSRSPSTPGASSGAACSDGERAGAGSPALAAGRRWSGRGRRSRLARWRAAARGSGFWDTAEFQTVAPLLGTAHPTGYPDLRHPRLARLVVLAPFGEPAFRMNLFAALCVGGRRRGHGRPGPDADRLDGPGRRWRASAWPLTPIVWSIGTHADAHALHLALVASSSGCSCAGSSARVRRRGGARVRTAGSSAAAVVFGLSVGNHSLTLLLAPPIGLFVLAVEPGDPPPAAARRRRASALVAVTIVLVYLELPLRAGPFRAPLVYGRPTPGTASGTSSLGRAVPGRPRTTVRRPAAARSAT